MRTCVIERKVAHDPSDDINAYHTLMFHGTPEPGFPVDDNNLGDRLVNQLHVRKNVFEIADVFKPSRNLVVSERVRIALGTFDAVTFYPIVFSCLYRFEYRPGDLAGFPHDYDDFIKWESTMQNDSSLRDRIQPYYELVVPRHSDVIREFENLRHVTFASLTHGQTVEIWLSDTIMVKHPALWSPEGILMNVEFYEVVRPFLQLRYFVVRDVQF